MTIIIIFLFFYSIPYRHRNVMGYIECYQSIALVKTTLLMMRWKRGCVVMQEKGGKESDGAGGREGGKIHGHLICHEKHRAHMRCTI